MSEKTATALTWMVERVLIEPALKKGKAAWITGHLDMPHTFTVNGDMAQALVTPAAEERAWGRHWHVPSSPSASWRGATPPRRADRRDTAVRDEVG